MYFKFIDVRHPQIHSCPLMPLITRCTYGRSFNALFLMVSLVFAGSVHIWRQGNWSPSLTASWEHSFVERHDPEALVGVDVQSGLGTMFCRLNNVISITSSHFPISILFVLCVSCLFFSFSIKKVFFWSTCCRRTNVFLSHRFLPATW